MEIEFTNVDLICLPRMSVCVGVQARLTKVPHELYTDMIINGRLNQTKPNRNDCKWRFDENFE